MVSKLSVFGSQVKDVCFELLGRKTNEELFFKPARTDYFPAFVLK